MYISRIEISGVKGFSGARSVDLDLTRPDGSYAGWTVLAGRNGSGKTSLLRATAVGLGLARPADLAGWSSARNASVSVSLKLSGDEAGSLLGGREGIADPAQEPLFPGAPLLVASCTWKRVINRRSRAVHRRPSWTAAWHQASTAGAGGLRVDLPEPDSEIEELPPVIAVGAFRRLGHELGRGSGGGSSAVESLFNEDATLTDGVGWLIEQHHRKLTGDEQAGRMLDAVLALLGDGLLPDDYEVDRVDADGPWVVRSGRQFSLWELSDGFRSAVALVVHILWKLATHPYGEPLTTSSVHGRVEVSAPGVVLIDEVDAHLHVSWQQRIGGWLKTRFPNVQFIVTTHSPYICQAADPGGLVRLAGPDEEAAPEVVSEDLYRRVVYGSGDDAVLSELFGLESPYSDDAQASRRRIGDLEGRVLEGNATAAELAEYEALSQKLNSSLSARVDEVAARLARSE
ncbi:AAA family ATPase [Streptacidiphilus sp. N1-12]|uniref:AAA family ATPase n=2 Tax=Streptacidiphilus alkalitolerans TaxID=3342712 RepID=A0ABV6WLV2_9ACTN